MYESVLIDPWLLLLFFLMTKFQQQSIIIRCTTGQGVHNLLALQVVCRDSVVRLCCCSLI